MSYRVEKVCVLGDCDVGKTCITLRFVEDRFDGEITNTIGAAFKSRFFTSEKGTTFKFQIWDTAGQERYKSLAPMYYRGASVVILVFDLAVRASLEGVKYWMQELKRNGPSGAVMALVGNKLDLAPVGREISSMEGMQHASEIGAFYCETSAKTGENVVLLFEEICSFLQERTPIAKSPRIMSVRLERQLTVREKPDFNNGTYTTDRRCCPT